MPPRGPAAVEEGWQSAPGPRSRQSFAAARRTAPSHTLVERSGAVPCETAAPVVLAPGFRCAPRRTVRCCGPRTHTKPTTRPTRRRVGARLPHPRPCSPQPDCARPLLRSQGAPTELLRIPRETRDPLGAVSRGTRAVQERVRVGATESSSGRNRASSFGDDVGPFHVERSTQCGGGVRRCGSVPSRRRPAAPRGGGTVSDGTRAASLHVPAEHPGTVAVHAGARLHRARRRANAEGHPRHSSPGDRRPGAGALLRSRRPPFSQPATVIPPSPAPGGLLCHNSQRPRSRCRWRDDGRSDNRGRSIVGRLESAIPPHALARRLVPDSPSYSSTLASAGRHPGVLDRSRPASDRPADLRAQTRRRFCAPRAVESSPPRPRLRRPSHSSCPRGEGHDARPRLIGYVRGHGFDGATQARPSAHTPTRHRCSTWNHAVPGARA